MRRFHPPQFLLVWMPVLLFAFATALLLQGRAGVPVGSARATRARTCCCLPGRCRMSDCPGSGTAGSKALARCDSCHYGAAVPVTAPQTHRIVAALPAHSLRLPQVVFQQAPCEEAPDALRSVPSPPATLPPRSA